MELLFVALGPSLLWLWWFWKEDPEKNDANQLATIFLYGAASFLVALALESVLYKIIPPHWLIGPFLITAPVEETCKFAAVRFAVHKVKTFDRPADGIIYAAAAALGFSFSENLLYFSSFNPGVIFLRIATSVPAHVLFAVPYGAALGNFRCLPRYSRVFLYQALLIAIFFHGCFDAVLIGMSISAPLFLLLFLALMEGLWLTYKKKLNELKKTDGQVRELRDLQIDFLTGPLKWNWIAVKTLLGLASSTATMLVLPKVLDLAGVAYTSQQILVAVVAAMFLTGLTTAYFAKGRTVRESAIALFWVGAVFGYILHSGREQLIAWTVGLAVLGAFAGWFGDALEDRNEISASREQP